MMPEFGLPDGSLHMGRFCQTGGTAGFHAGLMDGFARNGSRGGFAGEEPLLRTRQLPIGAQQAQEMGEGIT